MSVDLWAEIEKSVAGGYEGVAHARAVVEADADLTDHERQMMLARLDQYASDFEKQVDDTGPAG